MSEQHARILIRGQNVDYIYDLDSQQILHEVECYNWSLSYLGRGYSSDFSPDGKLLACNRGIYDVAIGEKLADIPVNGTAFAFSPDGTQLAVAASWDVLIYDVAELLEWKSAKNNFARYNQ